MPRGLDLGLVFLLAVLTDSHSQLAPSPHLDPSGTFGIARGTRFLFGPVAGAAAATALQLAQIEAQAQIALRQLTILATITVGNQCHNSNGLTAALSPQLALLTLLNRQHLPAVGFNVNSNYKTYRTTRQHQPPVMYHHPSQQPGSQPFSNVPRPPHHQQTPNQQQSHPPNDMMNYQFPRPTQLPDELESALAIRGSRDVDHRLMDHATQQSQHPNQGSGPGIGQRMSEHGNYGTNPIMLASDNQSGQQQEADWTSYQPSNKLFVSTPHSTSHQPQQLQGPQQPQSWTAPVTDSPSPQAQHSCGSGNSGGADESAGSILASFGLSNEDLEVLSHYPDDQLTPDTLPFILRDIQITKSTTQKNVSSTSSSSFSLPPSHSAQPARSHSPEVPSLFTVTQTTGKVIDYGHASRTKDESSTRETFKRERLSGERTVKMVYPSSSAPKADAVERRHVRLEPANSDRHGDRDYRKSNRDIHKTKRSPVQDFLPSSKSRHLDRDYRQDGARPRPSSETKSEPSPSRRSLSSSSGSKTHSGSKKLPTPTMISDFKAMPPKVYPHTCSLCGTQCDQEKDWIDHINTVNHTAACRDLRNKYPDWKPHTPRSGQYGSQAVWDPKDHSPSCSVSRSISCSLSPSPPSSRHGALGPHRQHGRPYPPHHYPRHPYHTAHDHRLEPRHSGSQSPTHSHRNSSSSREHREHRSERKIRESSGVSTGSSFHSGLKRPHDDSAKTYADPSHHPSSNKTATKMGTKPGTKTMKTGNAKAASSKHPDTSTKPPPAKKKKKVSIPTSQSSQSVAARLVYLIGIPVDASEQEVTDLVGSFGKINNVVLMPSSGEEDKKDEGQKASVCMVRPEDAKALARCANLSIRNQVITASLAKKFEAETWNDVSKNKSGPTQDRCAAMEEFGNELDQKTSDEKAVVLITGLPESGWSDADIINIIQPFGTPSDIILATEIGKVLVLLPDKETAEEMVKVHNFAPARINDTEVKMIHLKQRISLNTPVALYNLLLGSLDPLENPAPVGWSSLLIISNVPETPTGPTEVQKLVRRFGTVIKTLVLNNNLVICEMATPAMAMSVYRRFQKFPCIIQNNPLSFSRKPDPKANTQSRVIQAFHDSSKVTCTNGKDIHKVPPEDGEESEQKEVKCEAPSEEMEKDSDQKDGEKMEVDEKAVSEEEAKEEIQNTIVNKVKQEELATEVSITSVTSDAKPGEDFESKTLPDEAVIQKAEENKAIGESQAENGMTPAGDKETQPSSSDAEAASNDMPTPPLPKVTREMVHALLEECRTRSARNQNKPTTAPPGGEQEEAPTEAANREVSGEMGKEPAKKPLKEPTEDELKQQEMERKEKEEKREKEPKERRERRGWEREEKTRREREREERSWRNREKREEERWDWERRERERRQRRRTYDEGSSGWRPYERFQAPNKVCSWRNEQNRKVEKVEESDDFPFNMSDFVTVDEVGDVTYLPQSPPLDVPMETIEGGEDMPASVKQDSVGSEATHTQTAVLDATPVKSEEPGTESVPVAASESYASSNLTPGLVLTATASTSPALQADSSAGQTDVPVCPQEPETSPETENTPIATLDSTSTEEPQPTSAPAASDGPPEAAPADLNTPIAETGAETAESEEKEEEMMKEKEKMEGEKMKEEEAKKEEKDESVNPSQGKAEDMAAYAEKKEEQEVIQDEGDEAKKLPAPEIAAKIEKSEEDTNTQEKCVKKKLTTQTPAESEFTLPPFDSSNPVGMEFLVPKTGFFCKVCNRFFTGTKEAEINHCKTLKHYENLKKHLGTRKTANVTPKRGSS
ncbi:hypothetical protein LDENG_00098160 [Lucifuga dentata]|nr:hypothetical protein LDENG_00098160 [Lucifuga dentata]